MPDTEGRTALMWAAQRGNYKVLEVMLQKEVDIHAFDTLGGTGELGHKIIQACLSIFIITGMLFFLLLYVALHTASLSGHASCVLLLLQVCVQFGITIAVVKS